MLDLDKFRIRHPKSVAEIAVRSEIRNPKSEIAS
jgi:hypothetical protein